MEGGCYCGKIRYQAQGKPRTVVQCHCGQCRRSVGATPVSWASFARQDVRFDTVRWHRPGTLSRRGFCPACGTSLFFQHRRWRHELDITVCSLDDPELLPPQRHCFTPDRLGWVALESGLPRHRGDTHSPLLSSPVDRQECLLEIYRRALNQIALQAYPDPPRVVALAESLLPAYKYDRAELREALSEYVQKYPDGADYLLEPLDTKLDSSL